MIFKLITLKKSYENNSMRPNVKFFSYVIIKYWYGNNSNNYYHWIDVLGLSEPAERNWLGEEKVLQ